MPLPLVDWKGLVSSVGRELRAPEACTEADNVWFDAPGCIRKRRGYERLRSGTNTNSDESFFSLFNVRQLGTSVLAHTGPGNPSPFADTIQYGSGTGALSTVALDSGVTCTNSPNASRETGLGRAQYFYCNSAHYLTGSTGVVRVDSDSSYTPNGARYAGQPNGMEPNTYQMAVYNVLTGGSGFLTADASVAYRVTWHRRMANGTELGGAPTGRLTVRNIDGTSGWIAATPQDVTLRILVPPAWGTNTGAATTDWYCKLWRTKVFIAAAGDPDDEMYQVGQATLTNTDISNGFLVLTDSTPDTFLKTALHTNANDVPVGEANNVAGLVNSDSPPPMAGCSAFWAGCAWYGDTLEAKSTLWRTLTLPGDGKTIVINGVTMTFKNTPAGANHVQRVSSLGSLTLNIEATIRNLVELYNINAIGTSRPLLYYYSVGTTEPGQFLVVSRIPTEISTLTVTPGQPSEWLQMTVPGLAASSKNAFSTNTLAYSKAGRPDAVAPENRLSVGGGDARILKMMPMQTSLAVFTTAGVYRVTGTSWADFSVQPFDQTYHLIAAPLVATCDDRIYAWCFEGIIEFSEGGARPVSLAIEPTLTEIRRSLGTAQIAEGGFGVGHTSGHRVQFFYPNANDIRCRQWLTYDTRTECWSTGSFASASYAVAAAVVRNPGTANDQLILGSYNIAGDGCYLLGERQAYNNTTDFQDDGLPNLSVAAAAVQSTLYWKFLTAKSDAQSHWQQQVLQLEGNEFSWLTPDPTAVVQSVAYDTDLVTTPVSTTLPAITTFNRVIRLETPQAFRRGNQLGFRITDTGTTFFGLVGLNVNNGDMSRWPK